MSQATKGDTPGEASSSPLAPSRESSSSPLAPSREASGTGTKAARKNAQRQRARAKRESDQAAAGESPVAEGAAAARPASADRVKQRPDSSTTRELPKKGSQSTASAQAAAQDVYESAALTMEQQLQALMWRMRCVEDRLKRAEFRVTTRGLGERFVPRTLCLGNVDVASIDMKVDPLRLCYGVNVQKAMALGFRPREGRKDDFTAPTTATSPVTLPAKVLATLGIPASAKNFAYMYGLGLPLECSEAALSETQANQLRLLTDGGFFYLDGAIPPNVVHVAALVDGDGGCGTSHRLSQHVPSAIAARPIGYRSTSHRLARRTVARSPPPPLSRRLCFNAPTPLGDDVRSKLLAQQRFQDMPVSRHSAAPMQARPHGHLSHLGHGVFRTFHRLAGARAQGRRAVLLDCSGRVRRRARRCLQRDSGPHSPAPARRAC